MIAAPGLDVPLELRARVADLYCAYSEAFSAKMPSVEQSFAQSSITDVCKKFDGISLDSDKQPTLISPYLVNQQSGTKSDNTLWLGAAWNIGDPSCQGSRPVKADECNQMLSSVLNDCDTSSTGFKYGGWKVNSCIVWNMGVDGTPRVNQPAPQPQGDPGKPFSCTTR